MKILILGGGISGLSAAWYLRKKHPDAKITLLEKQRRFGGWIETFNSSEKGPRTFAASRSQSLLQLIEEVGLKEELIFSPSGTRYLWHRGKLRPVGSFLPRMIPALIREFFVAPKKCEEETIYDFATRRFGRYAAETLFDPITLGIYAGDIRKLSVKSCFPTFCEWEEKHGSLVRAMFARKKKTGLRGLFTLRRGMESLIEALRKQLPAELVLDTSVEEICPGGVFAGGKFWPADKIISALPGHVIGRLTHQWTDFPTASMWVVNLRFTENVLAKKGFGYLVPTQEKEALLGMIWDSSVFPTDGKTSLTAMIRPHGDADWAKKTALDALQRHLNISAAPLIEAHLAENAIPQFELGYAKRLTRFQAELKETLPNLFLIGNYLDGGPSVDACIRKASLLLCS